MARVSFDLASLGPNQVGLELSGLPGLAPRDTQPTALSLRSCLEEAGLHLAAPASRDEAACVLEADKILGPARRCAREEAGATLALALFLLCGARGRAGGASLNLESGARVLSPAECRLLEDRLAWLSANAVLLGRPGKGAGVWLKRLAEVAKAEFGR